MRKSIVAAAVVAAIAIAAGTQAWSAVGRNDALSAPRPAVSLVAAVGVAERTTNGFATKAEYERTKAGWAYDVEVVSGARVLDVRVDAASGKILSSQEDAADTGKDDGEHKPD